MAPVFRYNRTMDATVTRPSLRVCDKLLVQPWEGHLRGRHAPPGQQFTDPLASAPIGRAPGP